MSELIDKVTLEKVLTRTSVFECIRNSAGKNVFEIIIDMPTTSEAEIRAKAIKDFLDKLLEHETENWVDHQEYGITWADLELVADQMKGRE